MPLAHGTEQGGRREGRNNCGAIECGQRALATLCPHINRKRIDVCAGGVLSVSSSGIRASPILA
eukprot:6277364-Pyramimonas_sp.AAC.1